MHLPRSIVQLVGPDTDMSYSLFKPGVPEAGVLLLACAGGDSEAFEAFYLVTRARLALLVRKMVWDRVEAEEVLQEVYIKVWRFAPSFDREKSSVWAWLSAVVKNHCTDHLRQCTDRRARECKLDAWTDGDEGGSPLDRVPSPSPTPAELLEHRQNLDRLQAVLRQLPHAQREALSMAFQGGYSHPEIASNWGCLWAP